MLPEVDWVPELPAAVCAGEPRLVAVDQEVVVEAVLAREVGVADVTLEGLQSRVPPQVVKQQLLRRETSLGPAHAAPELVFGAAPHCHQRPDGLHPQTALLGLVILYAINMFVQLYDFV